jgi:hypothetical protein
MKFSVDVVSGEYTFTLEGNSFSEELPEKGFFANLADYLRDEGLIPADGGTAGAPKPQSLGAGYSAQGGAPAAPQRPAMRPPAAAPASNWQCPVHGNEALGEGYGGKGIECKVWTGDPGTDDPQGEWVRLDADGNYKGSAMRDNSIRYWCRHKQASPNGNGGGNRYR